MTEEIKVDKKDVLNFVIGEDHYHPLERSLDSIEGKDHRYETFETFIYDSQHKQKQTQKADYIFFYREVVRLRILVQEGAKISGGEILRLCEELVEIAPATVKLPSAPFDFKGEVPEEVAKMFSNIDRNKFGDMKRDSSDDE
tara:strand:+ start:286 stop:711 length:426 start_codon:yes stop_codon:yes gene_type:complete